MPSLRYWDTVSGSWRTVAIGRKGDPGPPGPPGSPLPLLTVAGPLSVGPVPFRWYNYSGGPLDITAAGASVGVPPTGGAVTVDVEVNGTTVFTNQNTRPIIPDGGHVSPLRTVVATVPANGYVTFSVDTVGTTTPGSGLTVQLLGRAGGSTRSAPVTYGEHLITWSRGQWHYRGTVIVNRPSSPDVIAAYADGGRAVWDTSNDPTFTTPPPLAIPGDVWLHHADVNPV